MIITIDGPAGSGKSTTARAVADELDFVYLDTGAMYRAVALAVLQDADDSLRAALEENGSEVPAALDDRLSETLEAQRIEIRYEGDEQRVLLGGTDVSDRIREGEVGTMASRVSEFPSVRRKLVDLQRRIGRRQERETGGVVLDGRDTGTVVFPEADVKIFMDADLDERARRRREEYADRGERVSMDDVREEIRERDRKDRERDVAPLRRADDAVRLDTTNRRFDEQVAFVVRRVKEQETQGT